MPNYVYTCPQCDRSKAVTRMIIDRDNLEPCLCGGQATRDLAKSLPGQKFLCTDPISGWFDDIDTHPVYIRDRHHLKEECDKRGLVSQVLSKDMGSSGKRDLQNVIPRYSKGTRRDPCRTRPVLTREAGQDARSYSH